MTPQEVALLYQRGGSLTDMQILELKDQDIEAWACAIDPEYRKGFLPKTSKGAERGRLMMEAVTRFVERSCMPLANKIIEQEKRIAQLEARISELEVR